MGKLVGVLAGTVALAGGLVVLVAAATGVGQEPRAASPGGVGPGSGAITPGPAVPTAWLTLYQEAATTCSGLPWAVLAAVGTVESDSGQSSSPGVWSGANGAGAEGPMQFEPATFAAYATVGPGGARPASPYDPVDAVYTAAALLCADGGGSAPTLPAAIAAYNHSRSYVDTVLTLALAFGDDPGTSGTVIAVLTFAARALGTPYAWGTAGPGGFDCSGLALAAYGSAGVRLPRVAQQQFDAGPAVPPGSLVAPGDLVFFGSGTAAVDHVGIYVGSGAMIDAPHAGALVRFDAAHWPGLIGATRPA